MAIDERILKAYPELSDSQQEAIGHTEGPQLIIAGPGSGKTLVLVIRVLNILLQGLADASEILVCTFTKKAAFELRDRISSAAKKLEYTGDLSDLLVGTIHSVSNDFIMKYRHYTPLSNNYEVLDDLTQLLFIFENFNQIIGTEQEGKYLNRWTTRWTAIQSVRNYLNKITEELLDPSELITSADLFVRDIGNAYLAYVAALFEKNRIDFAHQQKLFHELLHNNKIGNDINSNIKYVMVDEYQDTNYVQEQLMLRLASPNNNICVVGDEDQSLYRFRGATVRNILEFQNHFKKCRISKLTINYRSHEDIVEAYDKFMNSCDWINPGSQVRFRYDKKIIPDSDVKFTDYPAVFSIWGESKKDEADRLADLVYFLKNNRVIEDYSQVAILLHSVRLTHSGHYLNVLEERGIPVFCPRARGYFENDEIRYMVACFAVLLGHYGERRGEAMSYKIRELNNYLDSCIIDIGKRFADPHPLARCLQKLATEIAELAREETLDRRLADYFYQFLAYEPFISMTKNENRARNLAIFSQLLNTFQNYYHYTIISHRNRESLRLNLFNSFLRLLYIGGINEYEDPNQPFPKGYVHVMTIHQAKGLEFPVVIVNSLDKRLSSPKDIDYHLASFYHRDPFEPLNRITSFDRMRLHYTAFSRAEKILALTTTEEPMSYFSAIWGDLPQWPYVRKDLLKALFFKLKSRIPIKKSFSFTSDLKVYETCPRQYQFFRDYDFTPSRSAEIFFGSLIHQTIEDIHRYALEGKTDELNEEKILEMFNFNFRHYASLGIRPVGARQKENALKQIMNYFIQNKSDMDRIIDIEVDVSLEKETYILTGRIDLLLGRDEKIELLDFKSQPKPEKDDERIDSYYKQLCVYAHILEQRYKKRPERLLLYWTGEPKKEDALMGFPYRPGIVEAAGKHFDSVVERILKKDYKMNNSPEYKVCKECDLRIYCGREGIIKIKEKEVV